jgi:hypothetical protein
MEIKFESAFLKAIKKHSSIIIENPVPIVKTRRMKL